MPHFEATVRVLDLVEADAATARRTVEERLQAAGFTRWQIARLRLQEPLVPAELAPRRPTRRNASYASGGFLLVAIVAAWALWFLWILVG